MTHNLFYAVISTDSQYIAKNFLPRDEALEKAKEYAINHPEEKFYIMKLDQVVYARPVEPVEPEIIIEDIPDLDQQYSGLSPEEQIQQFKRNAMKHGLGKEI